MSGVEGAELYPFSAVQALDLDPRYSQLRREQPLAQVTMPYGGQAWLVTRYEDAKVVFADPRFSRAAAMGRDVPRMRPSVENNTSILGLDPPEHFRMRKLVAKAFGTRRIERLRPRAQQITDNLLDRIVESGQPADLVASLALPLPVTVICELLGVPVNDRDDFQLWTETMLALTDVTAEKIAWATNRMFGYLEQLITSRRAEPGDDLLSELINATDNQQRLSERELVLFSALLLIAGHETTANQIGNFIFTLLTQPEQLALLRADPTLLPGAIEELLRYVPMLSAGGFTRIAISDVKLSGRTVAPGDAVIAPLFSANRDGSVFERADELNLTRAENPHLAFGFGPHYCVGAQLARMEIQVALGTVLQRFPNLLLAVPPQELTWRHGGFVRGLRRLPVTW